MTSAKNADLDTATTGSPLVVAAAVIRADTLLVAQRSRPAHLAGLWEFPGGKLEMGEMPRAALHRELREELGLSVHLGEVLRSGDPDGNWALDNNMRMRVYLASPRGQVQFLAVHRQARWVAFAELSDLPWIAADRPIVQALLHRCAKADRREKPSSAP
ncbi:MAG: (deoxy)nucleoside triphosphate pyrophosphohydrolase [Bowdeniella nasicola]|nr:(deoxy)nucleoside triphosphate pyrophosphohydrolase [Bowdeniella nasicola]